MDKFIDSLENDEVFSALDANWGYWKVRFDDESISYAAFVCRKGLYEYKSMSFSLTNAPATFQMALDIFLARYKWQTCLFYSDDIIVFSQTKEEHLGHIDQMLHAFSLSLISLNLKKCSFFTDHIKYLGHIIIPEHLR